MVFSGPALHVRVRVPGQHLDLAACQHNMQQIHYNTSVVLECPVSALTSRSLILHIDASLRFASVHHKVWQVPSASPLKAPYRVLATGHDYISEKDVPG